VESGSGGRGREKLNTVKPRETGERTEKARGDQSTPFTRGYVEEVEKDSENEKEEKQYQRTVRKLIRKKRNCGGRGELTIGGGNSLFTAGGGGEKNRGERARKLTSSKKLGMLRKVNG